MDNETTALNESWMKKRRRLLAVFAAAAIALGAGGYAVAASDSDTESAEAAGTPTALEAEPAGEHGSGGEAAEPSVGEATESSAAASESGVESSESGGGEHGASGEGTEAGSEGSGGEGEEGGTPIGPQDTWDKTRKGLNLVTSFDPAQNAFVGQVTNTTQRTICDARVEIHLVGGSELGPTQPVDLAPGESTTIELPVGGETVNTWTAHPEQSTCPDF